MRKNGFLVFATCCFLLTSLTSCQKIKGIFGKKKSATTGWNYNDSKNGGIAYNKVKAQKTGPGLVFIPGGTFVMGRTQEDVMDPFTTVMACLGHTSTQLPQATHTLLSALASLFDLIKTPPFPL